ncbi:hypothetical protein E1301_Tti018055 [Triplophysa tibetana]|uniref:Uncharacterized protein n=1 Tax=Triplophysa tibetana TaxID=1572043 RepID=A0A5A9NKS8_9TELE|nr:hypothetical protein E1301_Tti018055 [Triplophysa tibetana]
MGLGSVWTLGAWKTRKTTSQQEDNRNRLEDLNVGEQVVDRRSASPGKRPGIKAAWSQHSGSRIWPHPPLCLIDPQSARVEEQRGRQIEDTQTRARKASLKSKDA